MKTFKVTLVIKLENGKDVQFIAPSIEDGIEFSKREGIQSIEIKEQTETKKETIIKRKTFNHAFDIGWAVANSEYEDPTDCLEHEKGKVFEALKKRIEDLEKGRFHPMEYFEAIGHFDTYEEEQIDSEKETT